MRLVRKVGGAVAVAHRLPRLLGASLFVATATIAPMTATGIFTTGTAVALSSTHKFSGTGNPGDPTGAVEPKAKVKFSCSSTTGTYTVKVSGLVPIQRDEFEAWPSIEGTMYLTMVIGPGFDNLLRIPITSDPATGYFRAGYLNGNGTMTGQLAVASDCTSGSSFVIVSGSNMPAGSGWAMLGSLT